MTTYRRTAGGLVFPVSGFYYNSYIYYVGNTFDYGSSTARDATSFYALYSSSTSTGSNFYILRDYATTIRCLKINN